jgi:hypothetical protein
MKTPSAYPRCYESHPPLTVGDHVIYGGSCIHPIVEDADVYIGFDHGMSQTDRTLPWVEGVEFLYPIQDMGVPKNVATFKKLVEWVAVQLTAKKKVHVGCIGGHGRTGLFLSALVKHVTGNENATEYVRENYCKKAVESTAQIDFLKAHFGIKPAAPTKGGNAEWAGAVRATQVKGSYSSTPVAHPRRLWAPCVSLTNVKTVI